MKSNVSITWEERQHVLERTKKLFSRLDSNRIDILKQAYSADGTNGEVWYGIEV